MEQVKKSGLSFEQMLENAMKEDSKSGQNRDSSNPKNATSSLVKFLKKGAPKYDPKKALQENKGTISEKNIEKKRIFKSNKEESKEELANGDEQSGYASQGGTFGKPRQSFIQQESSPKNTNRTVLPPSLMQAFFKEEQKN